MGTTALMIACLQDKDANNTELIKMLLKYEASNVDANGQTALDYAQLAGRGDLVEILKQD